MDLILIFTFSLVLILGGVALVFFGVRSTQVDRVSLRLRDYVANQDPQPAAYATTSQVRKSELSGSFSSRILLPNFKRLGYVFGRLTPRKTLEDLDRKLTIAGNPLGLRAREFYGLRLVFLILGVWLALSQLRQGISQSTLLFSALSLISCIYLPKRWLTSRVRGRQNKIRKGLPDALDMLSVCAEAGLGFDQSLQRINEQWKTPLGVEFGRVVAEMEMGISRRDALRHLAERLEVTELSSFVAVILQSDELGMSIAETLHAQAAQMREERRFRAQEAARKMPLKMLFPLIILIFPAMLAVILGPMIPLVVEFFGNVNQNIP